MENKNNNSVTVGRREGWFDQSLELVTMESVKDNPQEHV